MRQIDLLAGSWQVRGKDDSGRCISEWESVDVVACDTTPVDLDALNGCMDGSGRTPDMHTLGPAC